MISKSNRHRPIKLSNGKSSRESTSGSWKVVALYWRELSEIENAGRESGWITPPPAPRSLTLVHHDSTLCNPQHGIGFTDLHRTKNGETEREREKRGMTGERKRKVKRGKEGEREKEREGLLGLSHFTLQEGFKNEETVWQLLQPRRRTPLHPDLPSDLIYRNFELNLIYTINKETINNKGVLVSRWYSWRRLKSDSDMSIIKRRFCVWKLIRVTGTFEAYINLNDEK